MNFRKTALTLAVAGITAAPIAAQAEIADVYASVRIGLWSVDQGGIDNLDTRSFSSRFGVKAESDLGNGMTGFGRYEWDVDFNNDNGEDDIGIRQRIVGIKGDFGKITLGQTYHTFYSYVVGPNDIPWWHSGYAMISYRGRTDNGISYNNSTDAFSFGVTAYFTPEAKTVGASENSPDQLEVGVSFGIGDMTLGIALQTTEADISAGTTGSGLIGNKSDEDIVGVSLTGISLGGATLGLGLQTQDDDSSFVIEVDIGDLYFHIEGESLDANSVGNTTGDHDRLGFTIGYTQSLGKNTLAYYEFHSLDEDTLNSDDDRTAVMAVLKYNLI